MLTAKQRETVRKLAELANHPNTPVHEAEAARQRIKAITEKARVDKPTPVHTAEELRRLAEEISRAAGGDMFDQALRADPRTTAQRNADVQNRLKRCTVPESFFDRGGNPRPRNQWAGTCTRCGQTLKPGEGSIANVGGVWKMWCCESKPGPRRKKWN